MAIEKVQTVDAIEVVGEFCFVQYRVRTDVVEDGVVIASDNWRNMVDPSCDISDLPQRVQDMCNFVWTDEVLAAWNQYLIDNAPEGEPV